MKTLLTIGLSALGVLVAVTGLAMVNVGPLAPSVDENPVSYARTAALEPCYANQDEALLVIGYKDWADYMRSEDTSFTDPIDRIIPEGQNAGQWIMPGCFAVEDEGGEVTVWKTPLLVETEPPFWTPHQG